MGMPMGHARVIAKNRLLLVVIRRVPRYLRDRAHRAPKGTTYILAPRTTLLRNSVPLPHGPAEAGQDDDRPNKENDADIAVHTISEGVDRAEGIFVYFNFVDMASVI